jgi:hypothetical protein
MKTYWESGCIVPRILDLGIEMRWVVSFTPRPLYPQRKSPSYSLDRRPDGPQSRSEHGGEEKNSHPVLGFEPPIVQPLAQRYTTELSRHLQSHTIALNLAQCFGESSRNTPTDFLHFNFRVVRRHKRKLNCKKFNASSVLRLLTMSRHTESNVWSNLSPETCLQVAAPATCGENTPWR